MGEADTDSVLSLLARGPLLVVGEMGAGKSTFVAAVGDAAEAAGLPLRVVHADPGQPAFGPPACVARGRRSGGRWVVEEVAAVCTLDVLRHRLPLVTAVAQVLGGEGALLVDAPGVSAGEPASELLAGLAAVVGARDVLVLVRGEPPDVAARLVARGLTVHVRRAHEQASPGSKPARMRRRTEAWDAWLAGAAEAALPELPVVGEAPRAWAGRVVALLDGAGRTLTIGEVAADGATLRAPALAGQPAALLVRDVCRDGQGLLRTAAQAPPPVVAAPVESAALRIPAAGGRPVHGARVQAELLGDPAGDELLHLRVARSMRSVLVDLGAARLVPSRIVHQVTDVLVSHAHMDHFAGFAWLLRRRVGCPAPCRVAGPAGITARVASFIDAFAWDRVREDGPAFEVTELAGGVARRTLLRAGGEEGAAQESPAEAGLLRADEDLVIRAVVLDHGIPVLAYRVDEAERLVLREEDARARGLSPGAWVSEVRRAVRADTLDTAVRLPGAATVEAGQLLSLFDRQPGPSIAYATDLADTPQNRETLVALARSADVLVCEAPFLAADAWRARETGHLTARACGEIASEADVGLLVPFHFSIRYEDPAPLAAEAAAAFPRTLRWAGRPAGGGPATERQS